MSNASNEHPGHEERMRNHIAYYTMMGARPRGDDGCRRIKVNEKRRAYLEELHHRDQLIAGLRRAGMTTAQVAAEVGVTQAAVRHAAYRVRCREKRMGAAA